MFNQQVADQLIKGAVGVMPTDTVYGIVASARNNEAIERLYSLKSREAKPGTVIAAHIDDLIELGFDAEQLHEAIGIWPNPVSVVVRTSNEQLHMGVQAVAVRIPNNKDVQALLKQTGPLLTSSANLPGQPPATTISEARNYFRDDVDFYIDGGDIGNEHASTIIRIENGKIAVLREGLWQPN